MNTEDTLYDNELPDNERLPSDPEAGALQPIPDVIKYGGIAGLVLIIIIIGWIFSASSDEEDDETRAQMLVNIEKPFNPLSKAHPNNGVVEAINKIEPITGIEKAIKPLEKTQDEIKTRLTRIEEQFSQFIEENKQYQDKQYQLINDMQSQLTAQAAQIEQLQYNARARVTQAKLKTNKKKVRRYSQVLLPFSLVSVDQWGADVYAVVRLHGKLHELTTGQLLNQWRVISIDRSRGAAIFKSSRGTRRELFIKA